MIKRNRKSKILSTIGPATSNKKIIKELFICGADIFRLNFSHGSIEEHRDNYNLIREAEKEIGRPICVLADLQGPKLRIGKFKNNIVTLKTEKEFQLDLENKPGDENRVYFPHPEVYESLTPNSNILINDGKIRLQVIKQEKNCLITEIMK